MQPQGNRKAAACRLMLFVLGFLAWCSLEDGVNAFELQAKEARFPSFPLHGGVGWRRSWQAVRGQAAFRDPSRTVKGFAAVALNGEDPKDDQNAAHGGQDILLGQQGRRDHRKLGTMMDLFCFPKPKIGAMCGLGPALLPRGLCCMLQLQQALRNIQAEHGFEEVTRNTK